uniref:Transmembrane protein n=1 Tax=Macrostomum lignano TaxID=282301 RepID=A0A1I8HI10_9PLAT
MPPALSQQPASWKELIDNGNLALTSGDQNDNENSTAVIHVSSQGADPLSPSWSSSASSSSAGSLLGGTDLLPVYCGLLGCLILGLVAWILVKQMLRRAGTSTTEEKAVAVESALRQQHQPEHEHQEPEHQEQLVLFQFPLTAANSSGCRRPKRRSADSGFGGSEPTEDNILVDGRRLLRELSGSRMQRLENILANDADPDRRPSASIAHLARCLRGVGRSDALILFRESPLKSNRRQHRIVRMHKRQREERLTGQDEAAAAAKQPQQQREEEEDPDEKEKPEQNEAVPAIE